MTPNALVAISLAIVWLVAATGAAPAADCRDLKLAKERSAFSTLLQRSGFSSKQTALVVKYADGKVRAWRGFPLNERGRVCGLDSIGASVFGCARSMLPGRLTMSRKPLDSKVTDMEALSVTGFKQLTIREALGVGTISGCQGAAMEAFTQQ